mmetsp:Transcript_71136/g.230374  ORF Transcript_71136/g.230374 Transcript_71136/m.230374 type:complete len:80 (+) Transcript_71136:886-1125(+)
MTFWTPQGPCVQQQQSASVMVHDEFLRSARMGSSVGRHHDVWQRLALLATLSILLWPTLCRSSRGRSGVLLAEIFRSLA